MDMNRYVVASFCMISVAHAVLWSENAFIPEAINKIAASLFTECKDVVCVSVNGIASNEVFPYCGLCDNMDIKSDEFHDNAVIMRWYKEFRDCCRREYHACLRAAHLLGVPLMGSAMGAYAGKNWSSFLFRVTLFCASGALVHAMNKKWSLRLANGLDRRADRAALAVCKSTEERRTVLAYLREQQGKGGFYPTVQNDASQYHMFCINAYDAGQLNLCSLVSIHITLPITWLFGGESRHKKLKHRIAFIEKALTAIS